MTSSQGLPAGLLSGRCGALPERATWRSEAGVGPSRGRLASCSSQRHLFCLEILNLDFSNGDLRDFSDPDGPGQLTMECHALRTATPLSPRSPAGIRVLTHPSLSGSSWSALLQSNPTVGVVANRTRQSRGVPWASKPFEICHLASHDTSPKNEDIPSVSRMANRG